MNINILQAFYVCPEPGFPTSYVFFMFNDLRRDVIVRFVNIAGIIDHH